ncbi:hypothetical protein LCGC14_1326070 [marine sediment metagenome]|uniref:Uncharacterized protein n=1 Tax=marine sediment metagenome TaxID=412755 RepID=A0A0F9L3Y5_9ZZZZ
MRVNVYAAEITRRIEIVETYSDSTGATFKGVRFYLDSPESLKPPTHPDDDSSAVTFWVKSRGRGYVIGEEAELVKIFEEAVRLLNAISVPRRVG